jgi:2-methylcitrate dehydratase PrpD
MKSREAQTRLAVWIQSPGVTDLPLQRLDHLKRHIADTVGARLAGSTTSEGAAMSRLAASLRDPVSANLMVSCAQTRCTEVDDIHLTSCTTPGSVVVSTVVALASAGHLRSVGECCSSALAGYESLIRLGAAIAGPRILHRRVWPTHAAAAFGSAAAASRAYRLTVEQTAGALATALAYGSGPPVSGSLSSSSRWLTLGVAAANGELAARAARDGLLGTAADEVSPPQLVRDLGRRYLFDDLGMKPFPTARQGLAAIQAAREIAAAEHLQADEIDEVVAFVSELQRRIVDRPRMPASRFDSLVSLQYQIAVALIAPDRLTDVVRTPVFFTPQLQRLMRKIRVVRARDLDARYPRAWPARVTIVAGRRRFERLVAHPHGDARQPFTWDQVADKFVALGTSVLGETAARQAIDGFRAAAADAPMPALWKTA